MTAGQSESLSVFTASAPSGPRRQKYSGIRNDSGNFVYLVSCTTVSLRPDYQAANLSLVIVTIAILSMISCPRFQKRCKGTAFFRTRKLFTKFFCTRFLAIACERHKISYLAISTFFSQKTRSVLHRQDRPNMVSVSNSDYGVSPPCANRAPCALF